MNIDWKSLFLSAKGRIARKSYWIGWIVLFVASMLASLALGAVSPLLSYVVSLALIYPNVCLNSKRLHDMGVTGWVTAIPMTLGSSIVIFTLWRLLTNPEYAALTARGPFGMMGDIEAAQRMQALGPPMMLSIVAGIVGLGFWLWLGIAHGQMGPNKYGPDPRNEDDGE